MTFPQKVLGKIARFDRTHHKTSPSTLQELARCVDERLFRENFASSEINTVGYALYIGFAENGP
jgi:hypothetical protein